MHRIIFIAITLLVTKFQHCDCFVKGFGEPCNSTDDCYDHRQNCILQKNETVFKCLCDRFHAWGGHDLGCVQIFNTSDIVDMTFKMSNLTRLIEAQTDAIFQAQLVAGLFVFGWVILSACTILFYCIYIERRDTMLKESIENIAGPKIKKKRSKRQSVVVVV